MMPPTVRCRQAGAMEADATETSPSPPPTSLLGATEHDDTGHATVPPTVNIVKLVPWRSMTHRSTPPLYGARCPLRRAGETPLKTVIWSSPSGHSFTSSRWCRRSRRRRTHHHTAHLHFITLRTTTWCSPRCLPAFKSPVTPFAHLDEPVPRRTKPRTMSTSSTPSRGMTVLLASPSRETRSHLASG